MTRHPALRFGLLALIVALGSAPSRALGDEPKSHAAAPAGAAAEHAPAKGDAGHAEGAAEPKHESPNVLELKSEMAIWTVVVFVGLLAILGKYAWKPLLKALHDREEYLKDCLLQAEQARDAAERLMLENKKNLEGAADEVRALIEAAKKDAVITAMTIVSKAQADAEATRERAEREIGAARDQALTEIWTKTADLAVSVAGKLLAKEMTADDQKRLVDSAMSVLPEMATAHGEGARA